MNDATHLLAHLDTLIQYNAELKTIAAVVVFYRKDQTRCKGQSSVFQSEITITLSGQTIPGVECSSLVSPGGRSWGPTGAWSQPSQSGGCPAA